MKKLFIILFLFFIVQFSFSDDLSDILQQLENSTTLLQDAYSTIEELELEVSKLQEKVNTMSDEISTITSEKESLETEYSNSLDKNTKLLEEAYSTIDNDQKEIEDLRLQIKKLINSGVELKTYTWAITALMGYPTSFSIASTYNLPFLPFLGITVNFVYNINTDSASIFAGATINIK